MAKKRSYKAYKQGLYQPVNPKKYTGKGTPEYRSGLELKVFRHLDANTNVISWGSEAVVVPYISPVDGRMHRYFVDLVFKVRKGDQIHKYLVEIKPASQTRPPKPSGKKKPSTILYENKQWAVNTAKWASAYKWCTKNGYKWVILTEKDIDKM